MDGIINNPIKYEVTILKMTQKKKKKKLTKRNDNRSTLELKEYNFYFYLNLINGY